MKDLSLSKVYHLLEPGPVVLLTTARAGRANVMTMSWHMILEFEPPLVACVVSDANYSFAALRSTRECVIGLPLVKLAPNVVKVGNCSGRDIDKFSAFGLTPTAAKIVSPPLIAECFVILSKFHSPYNPCPIEVLGPRPAALVRKTQGPTTLGHLEQLLSALLGYLTCSKPECQ